MDYLTVTEIEAKMTALAIPGLCTKVALPHPTVSAPGIGPTTYSMLKIENGSGPDRPHILIVAGQHAREWAQPDAVLSFVDKLLTTYRDPASPAFTVPDYLDVDGNTWGPVTIPHPTIKLMIDALTIFVVPLANPDGRAFSQSGKSAKRADWRKNRAPAPASKPKAVGVDINRNFDIAWDFDVYYSKAAIKKAGPRSSKDPARDTFIGPQTAGAGSQPEVQNIVSILDNNPITWFIDLHSFSNLVMFPWGMERNGSDPTVNFRDHSFDRLADGTGGRDGFAGNSYYEFFPQALLRNHWRIAQSMRDFIEMATGRTYKVGPAGVTVYPTTGTISDFVFSRQLTIATSPEIHSFIVEFGDDLDGFQPLKDPTKPDFAHGFPKIEREIHAALLKFLEAALPPPAVLPPVASPPPPTPPAQPGTGPSQLCLLSIAVAGLAQGPLWLAALRDARAAMRAGRLTARPMAVADRAYRRLSRMLGPALAGQRWARHALAYGLVAPMAGLAGLALRATGR